MSALWRVFVLLKVHLFCAVTAMRRPLCLAAGLMLCLPPAVHGQRLADALVGTRVRLDIAEGAMVIGTVVSLDADSVRIETSTAGQVRAILRSNVIGYEVSAGRDRRHGSKRGALIGGAAGLALLAASLRGDTATVNRQPSRLELVVPVAAGLTLLGAGIGAALAPERWESPARVTSRLRLTPCSARCVALGFRF